jgi:hypothetical protein
LATIRSTFVLGIGRPFPTLLGGAHSMGDALTQPPWLDATARTGRITHLGRKAIKGTDSWRAEKDIALPMGLFLFV